MQKPDEEKLPLTEKEQQEREKAYDWFMGLVKKDWEAESHNPNNEADNQDKDQK